MKSLGKIIFIVLLIVSLLIGMTAFSAGEEVTSKEKLINKPSLPKDALPYDEQIFYSPLKSDTTTYMDIMKSQYNCVHFATETIQLPLVAFDKNYNAVPLGAESWTVSEDGLTWTFKLRDGMKWSDGKPITADDWVFTLQRCVIQGYDFAWLWQVGARIKNWAKVAKGELPAEELGIKALNDNTLLITTEIPKPYLPQVLTWFYLVPKHAIEKYGDAYATKADTLICSGPYKVDEWILGDHITLVPNPYYNGPWKPYLKKLVFLYGVSDPLTAFPAYLNDEIYTTRLNISQIAYARKNLPKDIYSWASPRVFYLAFDTTMSPFNDIRVRQALNYAIDRQEMCSTVLKDIAIPEYQILAKGFIGHDPEAEKLSKFNPAKAKVLLAAAGYPDGKGFPKLEMWIANIGSIAPWHDSTGEYLQAHFKKVLGIEIVPRSVEKKTFTDAMNNRKHNFFLTSYKFDYIDPSTYLDVFLTGGRHNWTNAEYDRLVLAADKGGSWEERLKNFQEAQKILIKDAAAVFMFQQVVYAVWKPYLKGESFEPNDEGITSFKIGRNIYNYTHIYLKKH